MRPSAVAFANALSVSRRLVGRSLMAIAISNANRSRSSGGILVCSKVDRQGERTARV
jgi:hypothetical protein